VRIALLALALALAGTGDAGGAEWRSRGSGLRLRLLGYGQLDGRFLVGWRASEGVEPSAESDLDVGRLRFGVSGEWSRLSAEVEADVVDPDPLKDAWLGVRFSRALRLRVGHQKVPASGEWMTSARRTDFLRRALPVEALAPGRDWGVELHGELARLEYEAGVFAGDGWKAGTRSGTTLVGRLVLEPLKGLRLGGSATAGSVEAAPVVDGVAGKPRGLEGVSASGFTYFERKYVDGRRWRAGAEASWAIGPVCLKGEYLEQRDERLGQGPLLEDLPAVRGRGLTGSVTWLLVGERKKSQVRGVRRVPHGPGAVELGARVDGVRWDDVGADEGFSGVGSRSRHLRPIGLRAFTGGVSWWPVDWARLMTDVVVERFDDPLVVPDPGRRSYTTLLARLQLELP
jgi:phosphate-selective porin